MNTIKKIKNLLIEKTSKEQTIYITGNESLDAQVDDYLSKFLSEVTNVLETKKQLDKPKKEIDVRLFASDVANLIDNAKNLIEFKNTILRRTLNRLSKEFDKSIVHEFEVSMEDLYGLSIGKSQDDLYDDKSAPLADRAGPLE